MERQTLILFDEFVGKILKENILLLNQTFRKGWFVGLECFKFSKVITRSALPS